MNRSLLRTLSSLPILFSALASAVPIEVTYTDAAGTGFFDNTARTSVGGNNGATLGAQRRIAFEYAAKRWSDQISGTIPIKIKASFAVTNPSGTPPQPPYLAIARPDQYLSNAGASGPLPLADTLYPSALANQLVNEDTVVSGTRNDIIVTCNAYYESNGTDATDDRRWYYGLDSTPPYASNSLAYFDFALVSLHEIGHGLGFVSHVAADGSYLFGKPSIWNRLMKNSAGTSIPSLNQAQRAAASISDDVFIASTNVVQFNNGNPAKVHAPNPLQPGSSMSHLDEDSYSFLGSLNELMTPVSSFGSQNFGPLALNSLRDMGYAMLDALPPTTGIDVPVPGKSYRSSAISLSGSATDASVQGSSSAVGLLRVKVALSNASGQWYAWSSGGFTSTTFNHAAHAKEADVGGLVPIPTGTKKWTSELPAGLPDGSYQIHVEAVDQLDQGSGWSSSNFTIDNSAPLTQVEPWSNGASIFNLDGFRIYSPEAQSVEVEIRRIDGGITWYWTGSNWSTTAFTLPMTGSSGRWTVNASLPGRGQWNAAHPIVLFGRATDAASNVTTTQIQVTRTASDTTPPVLTLDTPESGTVLITPSIPGIAGMASDAESGIGALTLTLSQFVPGGGVNFWNGSSWGATPVNLPVHLTGSGTLWTAPYNWNLPSGGLLPNGSYSLQITATNRETPAATVGVGKSFSVDYHPVYTWTGWTMRDSVVGNDNNSWGDPENWSPYGVPGTDDIAIIGNGDTVVSSVDRSLYGLQLSSGALSFSAGPTATVTTTSASEWNGGLLSGTWQNNGSLTLGGGGRQLGTLGKIRNAGTVTWTGGATQGNDTVTITNLPGALWILAGSGDAFENYYQNNQFINQGTLRQTSASTVDFNDWSFTLGGEIQKQGGTLATNANVTLPSGTLFSGNGGLRHIGLTLGVSGSLTNAAGQFEVAGGTFAASAPVVLNGGYQWSGGSWAGNLQLAAGSTLAITGDCHLNTAATFTNAGTVTWNSSYPLQGDDSVTVTNLPSGYWRLERTGQPFSNYYANNSFINQGLLEKTGTGETDLRYWSFQCPGETKAAAGTLRVEADVTLPAAAKLSGAGTLDFGAGTLTVSGEVVSTSTLLRVSGGTMSCGANAKIQGNWTWAGGSMAGTFENPVGRVLEINGSCQLNTSAQLTNKGKVVWKGGPALTGYDSVTVTNAVGGVWECAAAGDAFNNYYQNNQFLNQGQLKFSAPTGTLVLDDWTYQQSGTFLTSAAVECYSGLNLLQGSTFDGAGTFAFLGNTALKGASTFTATSTVTGGTFSGEATGSLAGTLRWSGGTFAGVTKVASGAALRMFPGGKTLATTAVVDVSGEFVWQGGDLTGYDTSKIIVRNGGVFRIQDAGSLVNQYGSNRIVIEDGGSLIKTDAGANAILWAFDNDGTTTINAGVLSLYGGGSGDGSFVGAGGVLRFVAGDHVLEAGASLGGGVEITGGTLLASGNAGGVINLKGGTTGGIAPAIFSFGPGSTWSSGSIAGSSRVAAGGTLVASGVGFKGLTAQAVLTVEGLLQWGGGASIQGQDSSTIAVASGGKLELTADGDLFSNYNGNNRLSVAGTLEKSAGVASAWTDEWAVDISGIVRCNSGYLDLQTEASLLPGVQFQGSGRTRLKAGNIAVRGTSTIQAGAMVEFAGATINGHADGTALFQSGAIDWSGGWINGVVTLDSTVHLIGAGEKVMGAGAELRNARTLVTGGTGPLTGYDTSKLRNLAGGTLTCLGSNHFANYYGNNKLINEGSMDLGAPQGRQTMDWAFQQTTTGRLALSVAGPNATTPEFDNLYATGGAQLAGRLEVVKTGGYAPPVDTIFAVIGGSTVTGTFEVVQASGFTVEYEGSAVKLHAGAAGLSFDAWAASKNLSGAAADAGADPDGDGLSNFMEYAFNLNPLAGGSAPTNSAIVTLEGQRWLTLRYRRWQDRVDAGVSYQVERSANMGTWNGDGLIDEADPDASVIAGSEGRRCRIALGAGKQLVRIRVE